VTNPAAVIAVSAANTWDLVTMVGCDIGIWFMVFAAALGVCSCGRTRYVIETSNRWDFWTNWAAGSEELIVAVK
jgi:hypothetical protein